MNSYQCFIFEFVNEARIQQVCHTDSKDLKRFILFFLSYTQAFKNQFWQDLDVFGMLLSNNQSIICIGLDQISWKDAGSGSQIVEEEGKTLQ